MLDVDDRFREGERGGDTGERFGDCGAEEEEPEDIVDEGAVATSFSSCLHLHAAHAAAAVT